MANIIPNSLVDNAPNWDSTGKRKLRQLGWTIINQFGNTEIGEEILDRLLRLEEYNRYTMSNNVNVTTLTGEWYPLNASLDQVLAVNVDADVLPAPFHVDFEYFIDLALDTTGSVTLELEEDVPCDLGGWITVEKYGTSPEGEVIASANSNTIVFSVTSDPIVSERIVIRGSLSASPTTPVVNFFPRFTDNSGVLGFVRVGSYLRSTSRGAPFAV